VDPAKKKELDGKEAHAKGHTSRRKWRHSSLYPPKEVRAGKGNGLKGAALPPIPPRQKKTSSDRGEGKKFDNTKGRGRNKIRGKGK